MSTEQFHNPDNLTPEQVGEGWRLHIKDERIHEDSEFWSKLYCEWVVSSRPIGSMGIFNCTYRTRRPLPQPTESATVHPSASGECCELPLLAWMHKRRIQIRRSGYRGRDGWDVYIADPGGHYQEERIRIIGFGSTLIDALKEAVEQQGADGSMLYASKTQPAEQPKEDALDESLSVHMTALVSERDAAVAEVERLKAINAELDDLPQFSITSVISERDQLRAQLEEAKLRYDSVRAALVRCVTVLDGAGTTATDTPTWLELSNKALNEARKALEGSK